MIRDEQFFFRINKKLKKTPNTDHGSMRKKLGH
jgi:hypothetical protein